MQTVDLHGEIAELRIGGMIEHTEAGLQFCFFVVIKEKMSIKYIRNERSQKHTNHFKKKKQQT